MTSASSCSARDLVRRVGALVSVVALAGLLAGCGRTDEPALYGVGTSLRSLEQTARPLSTLDGAANEAGETQASVTVRGTIGKVCQSMGCWFYLTDTASMLLIDLDHGAAFTIPRDATGREAIVRGRLVADGGDRRIQANAAAIYSAR